MNDPQVLSSLGMYKTDVLRSLLAIMLDASMSTDQRQAAKQSLQHIGDLSIVDTLGKIVEQSDDSQSIADASEVLGFTPVTAGTETSLIKLMWHDSSAVRRTAMQSLARVGDRRSASILHLVVSDSQNPATIFDAAEGTLAEQARQAILRRSLS